MRVLKILSIVYVAIAIFFFSRAVLKATGLYRPKDDIVEFTNDEVDFISNNLDSLYYEYKLLECDCMRLRNIDLFANQREDKANSRYFYFLNLDCKKEAERELINFKNK